MEKNMFLVLYVVSVCFFVIGGIVSSLGVKRFYKFVIYSFFLFGFWVIKVLEFVLGISGVFFYRVGIWGWLDD